MRAKRTDANHADIRDALRAIGAQVVDLYAVGGGCPDMLVGFRGRTVLIEAKTATGKLTPAQQDFFRDWTGEAYIVQDVAQAIRAVSKRTI